MALSGKLAIEIPVKAPASKFFNLFTKELHNVQNLCERVHHTKLVQGDWHAVDTGSIKQWTYVIDGKVITAKESIESIDEQSKTIKYILFDGDISQHYKVFKLIIQVTDQIGGGSIVKWIVEYEKINENVESPYGYMEHLEKSTIHMDNHLHKA